MRWKDRLLIAAIAVLVGHLTTVPVWADETEDASNEKARLKRWDQQFEESLGWYVVSSGPNNSPALKPQRVMRWTNPTRKQRGEPTLVFWIGAGRPEALASVYPWGTNLTYECVSMARGAGLTLREDGRMVWSPRVPGVTLRELGDAPEAAETAVARLVQARSIAERFKVSLTADNGVPRELLRLLPKPIYRYPVPEVHRVDPNLIDGAVFAFVQGTDPEAVLLIENVRHGDRSVWQFAFARATGYTVEARLDGSVVWTAPNLPSWNDPASAGIILGRPLVD
jgi:hypothetical protein